MDQLGKTGGACTFIATHSSAACIAIIALAILLIIFIVLWWRLREKHKKHDDKDKNGGPTTKSRYVDAPGDSGSLTARITG